MYLSFLSFLFLRLITPIFLAFLPFTRLTKMMKERERTERENTKKELSKEGVRLMYQGRKQQAREKRRLYIIHLIHTFNPYMARMKDLPTRDKFNCNVVQWFFFFPSVSLSLSLSLVILMLVNSCFKDGLCATRHKIINERMVHLQCRFIHILFLLLHEVASS